MSGGIGVPGIIVFACTVELLAHASIRSCFAERAESHDARRHVEPLAFRSYKWHLYVSDNITASAQAAALRHHARNQLPLRVATIRRALDLSRHLRACARDVATARAGLFDVNVHSELWNSCVDCSLVNEGRSHLHAVLIVYCSAGANFRHLQAQSNTSLITTWTGDANGAHLHHLNTAAVAIVSRQPKDVSLGYDT